MKRPRSLATLTAVLGVVLLAAGYLRYSAQNTALLAAEDEISESSHRSDRAWVFADEFMPASALTTNGRTAQLAVTFKLVNLGTRAATDVRIAASLYARAGELPLGSIEVPPRGCGAVERSQGDPGFALVPGDEVAKSLVVILDPASKIPDKSFSLVVAGCISYRTESGAKTHQTRFGYAVLHTGVTRTLAFEPADMDVAATSLRLVLLPPLESAD